ncbi:uncharacterized protein LOC134537081 isoform X1 [Bacillus rossius redtenbacheri]|uniref:uncharacterized protein LOC134537081 isoform X1 n=1 Tax=Bacillus rossius redtenbacheri TaxID=93214 RepID=UPI002FDCBC24
MPRNVEIKAKLTDVEFVVRKAKELSSSEGEIQRQHDVFFNVPNGRLKLRYMQGGDAMLIFYDREDTQGPKLSVFEKVVVPSGELTESLLKSALGVKGVVRKTRRLFLVGQTRVHVDSVQDLGDYMELEVATEFFRRFPRHCSTSNWRPVQHQVMLEDSQSLEDGQAIARSLIGQLGVREDDLVCGAYLDLLNS